MSLEPDNEEQDVVTPHEQHQDAPQDDADTPGIQKPDSEVLNETGMNTE